MGNYLVFNNLNLQGDFMVNGRTNVLGVIGDPIEHTFSPAMHNAGLKALGLNYIYLPFHVLPQDLESAVSGASSLGIRGLNVTIPHKQNIINSPCHF